MLYDGVAYAYRIDVYINNKLLRFSHKNKRDTTHSNAERLHVRHTRYAVYS